jgi:cobalamin biosynthesis protein CobT
MLLIRPALQPGRCRQPRADKSPQRHEASQLKGHARSYRHAAQQIHCAAARSSQSAQEKFGASFETLGTSHGAAQALYSMQGFMSARSDLRNPAGAGSDTVPTMRRDDDDSQS